MYKSKLQELCHRQSWSLPVYTATRTGPDHCPSFKADVTVNNIPFSPTDFGRSSKEAENDVARMAFDHFSASLPSPALSRPSVSPDSDMQHFYKNLLQELTRKEGYSFPVYTTKQSGVHHAPTFVSIVEIETDRFTGQESKTKKQAEMSAAKLACMTLKKRKPSQSPIFPSSSNLQANATADLHQNVRSTGDTVSNLGLVPLEQTKDDRGASVTNQSDEPFSPREVVNGEVLEEEQEKLTADETEQQQQRVELPVTGKRPCRKKNEPSWMTGFVRG